MLNLKFEPFPILKTKRLILRQTEMTDDQDIFFLRSSNKVNEFIDMKLAQTVDDARSHIQLLIDNATNGIAFAWAIELPGIKNLIGTICLWNVSIENEKAEVGYVMHPDFQGQGYMHEALEAVLKFGFESMNLKTIEAYTRADNTLSTRLLAGFNFVRDFEEEKLLIENGVIIPEAIFSLKKGS